MTRLLDEAPRLLLLLRYDERVKTSDEEPDKSLESLALDARGEEEVDADRTIGSGLNFCIVRGETSRVILLCVWCKYVKSSVLDILEILDILDVERWCLGWG